MFCIEATVAELENEFKTLGISSDVLLVFIDETITVDQSSMSAPEAIEEIYANLVYKSMITILGIEFILYEEVLWISAFNNSLVGLNNGSFRGT